MNLIEKKIAEKVGDQLVQKLHEVDVDDLVGFLKGKLVEGVKSLEQDKDGNGIADIDDVLNNLDTAANSLSAITGMIKMHKAQK